MRTAFKGLLDGWPNSFGVHNLFGRKGSKWHTPTLRGMEGQRVAAYSRCDRSFDAPPDGCIGAGRAIPARRAGIRDRSYDEAISWATKALHEQPNWATALRVAAIANALSDRMVEARAAIACLREVDPALRLGNLDRVAPPVRRVEDRVRFIEGLRKAGLPE